MPFYVYEIPGCKHREERNWGTEQEAKSAIKHVARRKMGEGAAQDDRIIMSEKKTEKVIYEGTLAEAAKGVS